MLITVLYQQRFGLAQWPLRRRTPHCVCGHLYSTWETGASWTWNTRKWTFNIVFRESVLTRSAWRLATGWTVWVGAPERGGIFSGPIQTGPETHPASCTMGTGSLSRGAAAGAEADCVWSYTSSSPCTGHSVSAIETSQFILWHKIIPVVRYIQNTHMQCSRQSPAVRRETTALYS